MDDLSVDRWSLLHWQVMISCERCGVADASVASRHAMTAYSDQTLNKDMLLCDRCAEEYYDYWTEMWKEYQQSQRGY